MTDLTHLDLCIAGARWLLDQRWCRVAAWEVSAAGGATGIVDAVGVSDMRGLPVNAEHAAAWELVRAERERQGREQRAMETRHRHEARARAEAEHGLGEAPDPHRDWAAYQAWTKRNAEVYRLAQAAADQAVRGLARERLVSDLPPVYDRVSGRRHRPRVHVVECKRTRSDWLADIRAGKCLDYEPGATDLSLLVVPEVLGQEGVVDRSAALATLGADGLPSHWGVVVACRRESSRGIVDAVTVVRNARPRRKLDGPGLLITWTDRIARSVVYRTINGRLAPAKD